MSSTAGHPRYMYCTPYTPVIPGFPINDVEKTQAHVLRYYLGA